MSRRMFPRCKAVLAKLTRGRLTLSQDSAEFPIRAGPTQNPPGRAETLKYAFLCGGSALAVVASLYGTKAAAATAAATAADTATSAVSELVVVAQKREQKIETVPVAITAFS